MRTELKLVETVKVAAPCPASWDDMKGDDQKRFCEGCGLHVHNLSSMTRRDAENLLQTSTDRLCIRYAHRADGVMLNDNCPPRLRPARALLLKRFAAVASFGLLLFNFTARTVEALQTTHKKHTRSKTPPTKGPAKPIPPGTKPGPRLQMILGRRISPLRQQAPPVMTGAVLSDKATALPHPDSAHANDPKRAPSPAAADPIKSGSVFTTTGVAVRF